MAKHLKTLCTTSKTPRLKYKSELDAKLRMIQIDLAQKKGRKRKGTASKDVPIRAYFHPKLEGGCGYWHLTNQEKQVGVI